MKLYKYTMTNETTDYRPSIEVHSREQRVKLIQRIDGDNNDIAYVYLTDEEAAEYNDITLVTPEEIEVLGDTVKIAVPKIVTKRQAKQQMVIDGIYSSIQPMIDAIEDPVQKQLTQMFFDDSAEYERDHPTIIQFATALGLSSDDMDQLFIKAARL